MTCWQPLLVACALLAPPTERESTIVDLELVLASDVSLSVDTQERALQRRGYAQAIRNAHVVDAITAGPLGRIAVTYVEWSGYLDHKVIVPWTLIDSDESALRFARGIAEAKEAVTPGATGLGNALRFSAKQFDRNAFTGLRRVIDISGDGSSNDGIAAAKARDDVVRQGITINGLPLDIAHDSAAASEGETPQKVEDHYRNSVIGGPGAFLFPVRSMEDFERTLRDKLVLEIASWHQAAPYRRAGLSWGISVSKPLQLSSGTSKLSRFQARRPWR